MADYRSNYFARLDWITVVIYLLMVGIGWLNIYAATYQDGQEFQLFNMVSRYSKQFVYLLASFLLILVILVIDSKFWSFFAYPVYGITMVLLIAVLFFGREINGAKSWFVFGPISLQPAEIAKIGVVLVVSKVISRFNFNLQNTKNLLVLAGLILVPALLVLKQNDTGSALVYFALILVFFREGMNENLFVFGVSSIGLFFLTLMVPIPVLVLILTLAALLFAVFRMRRWKYFILGAILIGACLLGLYLADKQWSLNLSLSRLVIVGALLSFPLVMFFLYRNRLKDLYLICILWFASILFIASVDFMFTEGLEEHQRTRINQTLGIDHDPLGAGYNLNQSKIAIGSGRFFGKGFLRGTQTRYDFVPEQSTDFIFCTVGEEWGFLGSAFVVFLFSGFLIRLIFLAERQRSGFSRIFGYGVFAIFFFHFMINIGMTIGLVPVIGIPLPYFSYGGSSLWSFTILLFIFVRLDTDRFEVVA